MRVPVRLDVTVMPKHARLYSFVTAPGSYNIGAINTLLLSLLFTKPASLSEKSYRNDPMMVMSG